MLMGINPHSDKRFVLVDIGMRGIQELAEIKQFNVAVNFPVCTGE
jgi:hypothetical protein